jgi:hypothetical protein
VTVGKLIPTLRTYLETVPHPSEVIPDELSSAIIGNRVDYPRACDLLRSRKLRIINQGGVMNKGFLLTVVAMSGFAAFGQDVPKIEVPVGGWLLLRQRPS